MYKNTNCFHLAVPCGDLETAKKFYTEVLGCKLGNGEDGKWIDIDFWGNELTLHKTDMKLPNERHDVDMGNVPVPHFGIHLKKEVFNQIKSNLESNNVNYIDKPYTRFKGTKFEHQSRQQHNHLMLDAF